MPQAFQHAKIVNLPCTNQLGRFLSSIACGSLLIGTLILPIGCSEPDSTKVVIFAGSSTIQALQKLETHFELDHPLIDLEIITAGSQTLAMQINEGAHADIFISANESQLRRVKNFNQPQLLVYNQIVAIAANPKSTSLHDSISNARRIIIAHHDVPAGWHTQDALTQLGLWEHTQAKVVSYELSVRSVLTKVTMLQADLGFVYKTDCVDLAEPIQMIEFPPEAPTRTETWIALHNESADEHSPAAIAYQYITNSPESDRIFLESGFTIINDHP